jgi:hypothetical protein
VENREESLSNTSGKASLRNNTYPQLSQYITFRQLI